jgi:hypothetical protein
MKSMKYFMIAAALMAVSTAGAQLRFGVRGGVNVANATFDRDVFRPNNITGFHLGPALDVGLGGIGFDAAVLYSRKGFESEKGKVSNAFLDVPVNVKFKLGLPLVNPYVAAGPYIDICIAGDKTVDDAVRQIKTKSFGAGLNFGAGVELFSTLQLGLTYSLGLTDNYETFKVGDIKSYRGKGHTWSMSAAVFF